MANPTSDTKVIIPARFSYLAVWEPKAVGDNPEKKYSASLIIPKSDTKTLAKIQAAIKAAELAGKDKKFDGKIPSKYKNPVLMDGDEDRNGDEAYAGAYYINAKAKTKPGIVDANAEPIMDQDEMYSGCYGKASVTFYAYNTSGNKGIAAGLNHIMKTKDGEPLGGRSTAKSDFGFDEDEDI